MPSDRSPGQRALVAQIAADVRWAHEPDRVEATRRAREALERRFVDEVDPDRVMSSADRAARVVNARRAYYSRLALASVTARRLAARHLAAAASAEGELADAGVE